MISVESDGNDQGEESIGMAFAFFVKFYTKL